MVVIGYDRYNVIVKGFSGKRITPVIAFIVIVSIWLYASAVCCPPFIGWGGYMLEGLFMTCSYDYLSEDWNRKSFILYAFIFNYCFPMLMVIFYYTQIVRAVVKHESALKAQAKKMNVESLRSNQVCKKLVSFGGCILLVGQFKFYFINLWGLSENGIYIIQCIIR